MIFTSLNTNQSIIDSKENMNTVLSGDQISSSHSVRIADLINYNVAIPVDINTFSLKNCIKVIRSLYSVLD